MGPRCVEKAKAPSPVLLSPGGIIAYAHFVAFVGPGPHLPVILYRSCRSLFFSRFCRPFWPLGFLNLLANIAAGTRGAETDPGRPDRKGQG